jgi:PAS domain S-box-containing protein
MTEDGQPDKATERRRQAEAAAQEGDERLRFALENCHIGMWDVDLVDHSAVRSLEHARIFGYERLEPVWSMEMFLEHVLPDDRVSTGEAIWRAIEAQSRFSLECRIRRVDGQVRWIWVAGRYSVDVGGKGQHLAGVVQDITDRKAHEAEIERLSRLSAALSQINQTVVRIDSSEELMREVPRVAVEFGGFKVAWVGRYDPQTRQVTPLGWAGEQWQAVRDFRHSLADDAETPCLCVPVIRENRSCVLNDLTVSSEMQRWLSALRQMGVRAAAVFPIRVRGAVWGVFGVYETEPDVFQDKEIALLEEAAMDIGYAIEHIENEAQRRQAERFQTLSTGILGILNEPLALPESAEAILRMIKKETGLDAAGIRLKDGDDFPYFGAEGFDEGFLLAENSVILRNDTGAVCRDADGQPSLECTCGMVLAEKCGPPSDHVTAAGSIWTNDSLALAESLSGRDPRLKPRDRCSHEGYLSVALIPIRVGQQVIGLLHLNDRRKDRFTPEMIRFFEGLTASFGIAVKRRQAEDALRKSEERFRALFEQAAVGVAEIDSSTGRFLRVNQRYGDIVGYSREEMLDLDFYTITHLDDLPADLAYMDQLKAGAIREYAMEKRYRRKDGELVWVALTVSPLWPQGDAPTRHVAVVQDITDRRRAEEEQEKLQAQLAQAQRTESVGRLAGGVAHDFNNMLGVILGRVELAKEHIGPHEVLNADLDEIEKAAQRSADLTRQLLAFARKQTIAPRVINLNETVEGMLKMLQRLIGEDIDLAWLPGDGVGSVFIDPSQVDQILANLCVNARDAIAGVGKITIESAGAFFDEAYCAGHAGFVPGDFVMLAVSDDGCGMDAEVRSHLFEPFFTTKETGKGTGLGLATVHGAVKQNQGLINVYSEPGLGATFKIYLPRHAAQAVPLAEQEPAGSIPAAGGETVLLVEDEAAILELTTLMLEGLGYAVIAAATPGEAIRLAREHSGHIGLLMTDVVMPEMNGRDLARNVLSIYPDIRRLFMSGYTANVIAHRGVLDEGVHFLQKPFSRNDLAAKVREALGPE